MVENREVLQALAERCETARIDPGLRYLEDEIYTATTGKELFNSATSLRYGTSLDAAVRLVPEGHEWIRKSPRSMTVYRVPADDKTWAMHHDAAGFTPALALSAAALRAHAARLTQSTEDHRG